MKKLSFIGITLLFGFGLWACSSPQERKLEAEAEFYEQKTEMLKEYRACLKKYEGKENQGQCL